MRIYGVVLKVGGPTHVVIAKNASEAVELMVKYLNQFQTGHSYEASDFCVSSIDADKFSEPMVIN